MAVAYDPTDLVSTLLETIRRFNHPLDGGDYYVSYGLLLDPNVEEKEVDPTLSGTGPGPGKVHTPRDGAGGVLYYLKTSQKDKIPQFNEGDHSSWYVAETGTTGIISGTGTYQDDSKKATTVTPVKYCFVFAKTGGNWLLKVAFASRVPL